MRRLPILLIEDDPDLAGLLAKDISSRGFETFVATSVGDALRLIADHAYSLIVADYLGPLEQYPYRWPLLQLLARFVPRTPVLALSLFREVPQTINLVAVVRLPDYVNDLTKALRRYPLAVPETARDNSLARYLAALWDGDTDEAARVAMEAMKAGLSATAIYENLLSEALYQIGEWWADESCTVAEEHGARVITERVMAGVAASVERRSPKGRGIVVACVEGERHELGVRMAADLLTWDGWTVRLLGGDVPSGEMIAEARKRAVRVVGLSATMQPSWEMVKSQIAGLRAAGIDAVIIGGQAFRPVSPEAVAALGADAKAERAAEGVELANQLADRGR